MRADESRSAWRKSSRSGAENCVEVAGGPGDAVAVRDSQNPAGPALAFTSRQWNSFTAAVKNGKHGR